MKFTQQNNNEPDGSFGKPEGSADVLPSIFAVATDALHDGLILCGQDGKIIWINASARKTCRLEWHTCQGKSITDLTSDSMFPMDGVAEAFANNASMVYIEESYQGSDYIVEIKQTFEPRTTKILFMICFKNVNRFNKSIQGAKPDEAFSSSLTSSSKGSQKVSRAVIDDDLERLIELGVKAWNYGCRILITGESGVGKSQYARTLEKSVNRGSKSFVHVNCASIPDTLFESELFGYESGSFTGASSKGKKGLIEIAEKGTLFLDEVGEIPISCQSKILRFLDDGSYMKVGGTKPKQANVHIISATNRNLRQMVEEETFRPDLYFRLNAVEVLIPPLRDRRNLVDTLIHRYLDQVEQEHGRKLIITKRCKQFLDGYEFPGNIRELENALQHMAIFCDDMMDIQHLPDAAREAAEDLKGKKHVSDTPSVAVLSVSPSTDAKTAPATLKSIVKKYERDLIIQSIKEHGSKRKAAKALGVDIATVVRKSR